MKQHAKKEVLKAVREIVENPPYVDPLPKIWYDLMESFNRWLNELLRGPARLLEGSSPFVSWMVLGLLLLILAVLLTHIGWTFYKFVTFPLKQPSPIKSPKGKDQTPSLLEERAKELAKRGEFGEAIRLLFLALLGIHNVEGPSKSKTPRECVSLIPMRGGFREKWNFLVFLFERSFFGRETISEGEFNEVYKNFEGMKLHHAS